MFNCVGCAASLLVGSLMAMDTSGDYQSLPKRACYEKRHSENASGNFAANTATVPLVFFAPLVKES